MHRALLLGDSIRLRYQKLVRTMLESEVIVTGPIENCASTRHTRLRLRHWLEEAKPDIVHVNCGLHDLRHDTAAPGPQVPLDQYEVNVGEILKELVRYGTPAIWATTTPVDEARHTAMKASRRYEAEVQRYNSAAMRRATSAQAQVNDLHTMLLDAGAERLLEADGVHLTEEGSAAVAAAVASSLRQALGLSLAPPANVRIAGHSPGGGQWRLANALVVLRGQIDRAAPSRSRANDGDVGDAEHAGRTSDHNPVLQSDGIGVVNALDVTHDPDHGFDADLLAETLRESRDGRISYVIRERRIFSSVERDGVAAWQWRPYSGANPHTTHIHVSVRPDTDAFDASDPWRIGRAS